MSTFTAPGDRVLILLPCERPGSVGDLLAAGLERLGAHPVRYGLVDDVARVLVRLHEEDANVVVGVPGQVLALVRAPATRQAPRPRLKSVLLTAEHVPEAIATAVEGAWGCTVYNHYGTVEMGLGGGVECAARAGYHLREADLYVEIVDPVSGELLPDGELGEVIFTTLLRRGMPLLRYRTGDAGRFLPEPCPCGTGLRRLEKIHFRWDDRVEVAPGHELTPADLDEALYAIEGVLGYTFELTDGALRVTIQTAAPGVDAAARAALSALPAVRAARPKLAIQLQPV
jgi:phenylacetate-coenzyme A ligase PaaK-like adenylate-forming protein